LDKAFEEVGGYGHLLHEVVTELHKYGCNHPSHQTVNANITRTLASNAMLWPKLWRDQLQLPHTPTSQLVSFKDITGSWSIVITNWITSILGKPDSEAA
jgi:hypothetical protein